MLFCVTSNIGSTVILVLDLCLANQLTKILLWPPFAAVIRGVSPSRFLTIKTSLSLPTSVNSLQNSKFPFSAARWTTERPLLSEAAKSSFDAAFGWVRITLALSLCPLETLSISGVMSLQSPALILFPQHWRMLRQSLMLWTSSLAAKMCSRLFPYMFWTERSNRCLSVAALLAKSLLTVSLES